MQTAAKINLFLIDSLPEAGFADSRSAVSDGKSYLHVLLSELAQTIHSNQAIQRLADRLIRLAEHAYCLRDMKTVQEASQILMNLPIDSVRGIGQYYQALTFKRIGKRREAQTLLESVAGEGPTAYRARAIQTLGTIYHEQGQHADALRLYIESARVSLDDKRPDLLANLIAHLQVSFIKSDFGDHKEALTDLENLLPFVLLVAKQTPRYFYSYHADLAYELAQVGRIAEAEAACSIALASPFAHAYPEWTDTRDQIAAKRLSASHSAVAICREQLTIPSQQLEPNRKPEPVAALARGWLAGETSFLQRAIITITSSLVIDQVEIPGSILDRVQVSINPRAPPSLS